MYRIDSRTLLSNGMFMDNFFFLYIYDRDPVNDKDKPPSQLSQSKTILAKDKHIN